MFKSKFLHKADQETGVVYVLMDSEYCNPVAVVTSRRQADMFMAQSKDRNWYEFRLNELPEDVKPVPPSSTDGARKAVEEATQRIHEFIQERKNKR